MSRVSNGPKILSIRPVQQANETPRFEVVSLFFFQAVYGYPVFSNQ